MKDFTEEDLYKLFVYYLVKNNVTIFNERDFSSKMKSYIFNKNFEDIFYAIKNKYAFFGIFPLSLNHNFKEYQVGDIDPFNRYTYDFSSLLDDNSSCVSPLSSIIDNYDYKYHQLVKEIVADYLKFYNFEKSFNIPLFINNTNPNSHYHTLTHGSYYINHKKNNISWNMITNTKNVSVDEERRGNNKTECFVVYVFDPKVVNFISYMAHGVDDLTKGISKKLIVRDASWVMLQGFENNSLKSTYLYTQISDLNKLKQIINDVMADKNIFPGHRKEPLVYTAK